MYLSYYVENVKFSFFQVVIQTEGLRRPKALFWCLYEQKHLEEFLL